MNKIWFKNFLRVAFFGTVLSIGSQGLFSEVAAQGRSSDERVSSDRTRSRNQVTRDIRRQERDIRGLETQIEQNDTAKKVLEDEKRLLARELTTNPPASTIVGHACDLPVCTTIATQCARENASDCTRGACDFGRDCFALYQSSVCGTYAKSARHSSSVGQCWKIQKTERIAAIEQELRALTLSLTTTNERLARARERLEDLREDDDSDCPDGTCQNTRQNSAQNTVRREISFLDYMPYILGGANLFLNYQNQRDIRDLNWATTQEITGFQLQQQQNYAANYQNYVRGATLLDQSIIPPNPMGGTFGANISAVGANPYAYQYMNAGAGGNIGTYPQNLMMGSNGFNLGNYGSVLNLGGFSPANLMTGVMGNGAGQPFYGPSGANYGGGGNISPLAALAGIGNIGGAGNQMAQFNLGNYGNALNGGVYAPQAVGPNGANSFNLGNFGNGLNIGAFGPQAQFANGYAPGGAFGGATFNPNGFIGSPFVGNGSMVNNSLLGANAMGGGSSLIAGYPGPGSTGYAGGTVPGSVFGQQIPGGPMGVNSFQSLAGGNNPALMNSFGQTLGGYQQSLAYQQQQFNSQYMSGNMADLNITAQNINFLRSRYDQLLSVANAAGSQTNFGAASGNSFGQTYGGGQSYNNAGSNFYAPSIVGGGTPPGYPGNLGVNGYTNPGYAVPPYNPNYNNGGVAYNGITWQGGFGGALQSGNVRTSF